ncbi:MAG: hypothetical protein AAF481_09665 [Acidobacteriota bacterium]
MDSSQIRELLPWFLNGTLEPGERATVIKALRQHPELRQELAETWLAGQTFGQRIPTEDVVAYVFGGSTTIDPEVIEKLADPEEVAMVRESLAALRQETQSATAGRAEEGQVVAFKRPVAAPRRSYLPAALAAGLMSLVAFGGWITTWQSQRSDLVQAENRIEELSQALEGARVRLAASSAATLANVVAFKLVDTQRSGSADNAIALPPSVQAVTLNLPAPAGAADSANLELRLQNSAGLVIERIAVDPLNNAVTATVPATALPPGIYRAELGESGAEDAWQALAGYSLEIEPWSEE